MSGCKDVSARVKIITDLLDLLDSSLSNIESLMVLFFRFSFFAAIMHDDSNGNNDHQCRNDNKRDDLQKMCKFDQ